ncbi:hypothetical protein KEM55_006177, partial [Ascosphaera atra]
TPPHGAHVRRPPPRFVKVVRHHLAIQHRQRGGVQRVLRDGDEHAGPGPVADDAQQGVDSGAGAAAQEDLVLVCAEPVAGLDELGDAAAGDGDAGALAVGAYALGVDQETAGALEDVGLVVAAGDEVVAQGEEGGVLEEGEDLPEEGDGLLVELLGVADVGEDDAVEGEGGGGGAAFGLEEDAVLFGARGEGAADGVFGAHDVGVDGGDG